MSSSGDSTVWQSPPDRCEGLCRVVLCCNNSGSFLSLYMGFASNGVNREYPGVGAANFAAVLPYDPRQESWYTEALAQPLLIGSARNRVPAYSASYYDPYVAQVKKQVARA